MQRGAHETILGLATAPSSTFTAVTVGTGQSLTIRNTPANVFLVNVHAIAQGTAYIMRLRGTGLHDALNGIYHRAVSTYPANLMPTILTEMKSLDVLQMDLQGSATSGDIEYGFVDVYYERLASGEGCYLYPDELKRWAEKVIAVENTLTTGTAGNWGGEEAINAELDTLKGNRYYAIAGCGVSIAGTKAAIGYRSADFTLRTAVIVEPTQRGNTRQYFIDKSAQSGLPCIPVFSSNNKSNTLVDCAVDENGADPIVTTYMYLLKEGFNPENLTN